MFIPTQIHAPEGHELYPVLSGGPSGLLAKAPYAHKIAVIANQRFHHPTSRPTPATRDGPRVPRVHETAATESAAPPEPAARPLAHTRLLLPPQRLRGVRLQALSRRRPLWQTRLSRRWRRAPHAALSAAPPLRQAAGRTPPSRRALGGPAGGGQRVCGARGAAATFVGATSLEGAAPSPARPLPAAGGDPTGGDAQGPGGSRHRGQGAGPSAGGPCAALPQSPLPRRRLGTPAWGSLPS